MQIVRSKNITISTRKIIKLLGGWRDLQYGEDWDLWSRAAQRGIYRWTVYPMIEIPDNQAKQSRIKRFISRVVRYRDQIRLGRDVFKQEADNNPNFYQRVCLIIAKIISIFYVNYSSDFNNTFDCSDPRYFLPLMEV